MQRIPARQILPSLLLRVATQKPREDTDSSIPAFDKLNAELPNANLDRFKTTYKAAVSEIQGMLTTRTPYKRPSKSRELHPFTQRAMPEIRRDKFKTGEILSKEKFAKAALRRAFPLNTADKQAAENLDEDLKIAIEKIVKLGPKIRIARKMRIKELKIIASSLEPMRKALDGEKTDCAREIASDFNSAWAAAIIDAMQWPDIDLPVRYIKGFDVIFNIPDSGVFRPDIQKAEISKQEFMANNTKMVNKITERIERANASEDPTNVERRENCWRRTKEEIEEKLVRKPRSKAQMDRKFGRGKWRCIGRSAIKQKGKWRCVDNGKSSKHNKATTMYERITCGRADFPIMVAREFARRLKCNKKGISRKIGKRMRIQHGTNDLKAAYRHVPTRQPQFTMVAVWDDDKKKVVYCELPGHNFGLTSAVVNFNRYPELAAIAARRLLWVVTEHYYDDNDTAELSEAGDSGQQALVALCSNTFFGFPFDPGKDVDMAESNEYLGVISDLSQANEGVLLMDVSKKRRKKIKELTSEILSEQKLTSGLAASLFGKARFMISPCFGSLGKACLQPIMAREYQRNASTLSTELEDSVEFIHFLCDALPPLELPLLPNQKEKIVIFTDAEGKQREGPIAPSGHLGFVVYHPVHGKRYAYAKAPSDWVELFDRIKQRNTYIGQYELAAAITPFLSLPAEWFQGYPVELWIDNSGAVGGLIKGYSGVPDCARIINLFHFALAKLGVAALWIDYVPSESNPADVPSRLHEMSESEAAEALREFGAPIEMILPTFANASGEWLSSIDIAKSVW